MSHSFTLFPIGTVRKNGDAARIEIEPRFADGLLGIEGYSHIAVFYWFDQNDTPHGRGVLQVHPNRNPDKPLTGVFATHSPLRPNLIAHSVCRLLGVEGTTLHLAEIDARDGSPVIDIKGYLPETIGESDLRLPVWYDRKGEPPLAPIEAISPVDGRYRRLTAPLSGYFSEGALIRYRLRVEVEYFIALCRLPLPQLRQVDPARFDALRALVRDFSGADAARVKEIEKTTNHDVKAVEYFLKEQFEHLGLGPFKEFIHFGLTSQDINNTAMPLSLKEAWQQVVEPPLRAATADLEGLARSWKEIPMLARTHGQPASPTRLGKEIYVFVERLGKQLDMLEQVPFSAKFGGATGNFNAHAAAYPEMDWIGFADRLVNGTLGLQRSRVTTQIEHYDNLAAFCDGLKRINTILIDLCRDIWTYISMEYFKQRIKAGEIGSSAMPHKVNPIDFENAEGNLGVANALLEHLAAKLPISRLQRDLTDSTVSRNLGVPLAHTLIACKSLRKGLGKLVLNQPALAADLAANWAVVAEALQTILRREGFPRPYEALLALTRTHGPITAETIAKFIDGLDVPDAVKDELRAVTPETYTGIVAF